MAHVAFALSEEGGSFAFRRIRDAFEIKLDPGKRVKIGPLSLRFIGGKGHLENGEFRIAEVGSGDHKVQIKELDLVWDFLRISIGVDVPRTCVGGFCLIPGPFGTCVVYIPEICVFEHDPDVETTLDLAGLRHEISSAFVLGTKKEADYWTIVLTPDTPLDIDWIDPAGMAKAAFDRLIDGLITNLLRGLPDWLITLLRIALGEFSKLIEFLLDLSDDLLEWISEKIGISLGIDNLIISLLLEYFYNGEPIATIEDPFELMPAEADLPAVKIPIHEITASILPDQIQFGLVFEA